MFFDYLCKQQQPNQPNNHCPLKDAAKGNQRNQLEWMIHNEFPFVISSDEQNQYIYKKDNKYACIKPVVLFAIVENADK